MDILRASTTMTIALANGAKQILPAESVEQAQELAAETSGRVLLGGERGGVQIEGFDLSNSPDDYGRDVVDGTSVVFTTTNGTRALLRAAQADEVLVGAFVNLSRIIDRLRSTDRPVHVVCAGTNGQVTGEDVLFAGAVVERLAGGSAGMTEADLGWNLNDSARIAASFWLQSVQQGSLEQATRVAQGGRNLRKLGYDKDIGTASQRDSCSVVGVFDGDAVRASEF